MLLRYLRFRRDSSRVCRTISSIIRREYKVYTNHISYTRVRYPYNKRDLYYEREYRIKNFSDFNYIKITVKVNKYFSSDKIIYVMYGPGRYDVLESENIKRLYMDVFRRISNIFRDEGYTVYKGYDINKYD